MPDATVTPEQTDDKEEAPQQRLTPLEFPPDYVPGMYAPWDCSPEPIYGPDELGEYKGAIDDLTENVTRADSAARIWEVLQAWEGRLFARGYHFLNAGWRGWGMYGGSSGTSGASIMQTQNAMKLFACNVYGARHDKIVAALSREVPGISVVPKDDKDPMDQSASEEGEKYLKVWEIDGGLKKAITQAASYFYTDDRVVFYTRTVADQTRWGTELPDRQSEVYGESEPEGVTPETEMEPEPEFDGQPARKEVTDVWGKLETKVPLLADEEHEMGWLRLQKEVSVNVLKENFPWIEGKIAAGGNVGGMDQIDRMARINVRLAVQSSSTSGESWQSDATYTRTWFRPSQYRAIKNKDMRGIFYEEFPEGLLVVHAAGELAFIRNESMSDHVKVIHPAPGSGQNRRAIGGNYLPLQKVLNANISLLDRYFRSAVPRRFALEPYIDTQVLNSQSNDPAKVTPVTGVEGKNLTIDMITGIEKVPQPNTAMFEFIQWLIQGAPELMDNASPAMFGMEQPGAPGTFGEARLNRDQALQVYSMPWAALCEALACASLQAIQSAAKNRIANISANLPGESRLEIELEKLQGSVLCYPESLEIPQTLAEQEEQIAQLLEQSKNVAIYGALMNDPRNLPIFAKMPSLQGLDVTGADAVEQQQGEFEILMRSGPVQNPQLQQVQESIKQGMLSPESQTPEGQQALQQLQQALTSLPPMVSTVNVAQDTSENHAIHAAITLGMLTSPTGRKLKNGNEQQQAIWQNFHLHWQEHMTMAQKLSPPKEMEFKGNVSIDPSKFPPQAQAEMFQAMGLQVPPFALQPDEQTHEITQEKEGVDAQGIPTKTKVSVAGKPLN